MPDRVAGSKLRTVACTRRTYRPRTAEATAARRRTDAQAQRCVEVGRPVDVRADESAGRPRPPRRRRRRGAVAPTRPEGRPQVGRPSGPAAASYRCPPRRGRRPGRVRAGPAKSDGELVGPQGGQVGGDGADRRCRGARPTTSAAPWASAGFRPASGSSPVTSAPSADSRSAASGSSVTTSTADTIGQARAASTVSRAKASARSPAVRRKWPVEPGLGMVEPLDRHDQAPVAARRVHAD